jgi:hypothetical protein
MHLRLASTRVRNLRSHGDLAAWLARRRMSRPWDGRERFSDTTGDEYEPGDLETDDRRVTPWWQQAPVTGDPETPPLIDDAMNEQ